MKLKDYLSTNGIRLTAFASLIGKPVNTVHQWAHDKRRPGLDDVAAIEQATHGAVRFCDWVSREAA